MNRWMNHFDGAQCYPILQQVLESTTMTLLFGTLLYCLALLA